MIETIFHLADIHIPSDIDRYDEYEKIFAKLYKSIDEEKKSKMIVISGDLFNDKCGILSYSLKFGSNFIAKLSKFCDVVLIDGNHDLNMHNNSEIKKTSTIEGMLEMLNELNLNNKIHHLKENKIYKINGVNFGLTTMFADNVTKIGSKNDDEIYIGLYHGSLLNSVTDLNYKINKNHACFGIKDFKEYDLVMLGDIHKHQFLDKNKRIAYPSSLIQQNYGENIRNHGYIKWDLNNKRGEFIEIPNEYCFFQGKIIDGNLIYDDDVDLKDFNYIRAKIEYSEEDAKKIIRIEKKLRQKFKIKELVSFQTIKNYDNSKEVENFDIENNNIIKIHEDYIKKISNNDDERKKLLKIILNIIDEKNIMKEKNVKKIQLLKLTWNNLFCFGGDNSVDFKNLDKVNGIIAENGWGKSSIIDTILYAIYQKCGRTKGIKVLNKFKNSGSVNLEFSVNDVMYSIQRTITPRNKNNEYREDLTVLKNNKNISESYKKDTSKMLEEIFGSYDELTDNNIFLQNGRNFIDKTDHEKKIIMYKIFGIEQYNQIYEFIKNKLDELKKNINLLSKGLLDNDKEIEYNNQLELLKESSSEYENKLEIINKKIYDQENAQNRLNLLLSNENIDIHNIENNIIKLTTEIDDNIKEKNELIKSLNIQCCDDYLLKINEQIEQYRKERDELKDKIYNLHKKISKMTELSDINKIYKKYESNKNTIKELELLIKNKNEYCQETINKIESNIRDIRIKEKEYQYSLKFLNELENENKYMLMHTFNDKCKDCINNKKIHDSLDYIGKIKKLKNFIKQNCSIENELHIQEKQLDELKIIKESKNKLDNLYKENINLQKLLDIDANNKIILETNEKIKSEISLLEKDFTIIDNKLDKYQHTYKKINLLENQNITKSIKLTKLLDTKKIFDENYNEIISLKKITDESSITIIEKNNTVKQLKDNEKKIITLINTLEINKQKMLEIKDIILERNNYEKLVKIYTEDKLIEKMLNKVIENVESIVNNILKDVTNFTLKIELNTDGVVINKYYKNEYIDARFLSGYEKFASNIALRIAFGKLNKYIKNDYIIIDEGFSSCDHKNISKINSIFDIIKKYYKWCIIISHIDKIKNNFDKTYYIKKENNIYMDSKIII